MRVALHREKERPGDVLRLEDQDAVAARSAPPSADVLMADIAAAGRSIAWIADGAWRTSPGTSSATRSASATGSSSSTARSS